MSIYAIAFAVYSLLIFVFLPVYLRNGILTMPDYLRRRFPGPAADLFTVLLLLSYVLEPRRGVLRGASCWRSSWGWTSGTASSCWLSWASIRCTAGCRGLLRAVLQFLMIFGAGACSSHWATCVCPTAGATVAASPAAII